MMTREEILKLPDEVRLYIYELQDSIKANKDRQYAKSMKEKMLLKLPTRVFYKLKGFYGIDYDSSIGDFSKIRLKDIRRVPGIGRVSVNTIIKVCQESNVKLLA